MTYQLFQMTKMIQLLTLCNSLFFQSTVNASIFCEEIPNERLCRAFYHCYLASCVQDKYVVRRISHQGGVINLKPDVIVRVVHNPYSHLSFQRTGATTWRGSRLHSENSSTFSTVEFRENATLYNQTNLIWLKSHHTRCPLKGHVQSKSLFQSYINLIVLQCQLPGFFLFHFIYSMHIQYVYSMEKFQGFGQIWMMVFGHVHQ